MIRFTASGNTAQMDKFLANAGKTSTIESRIRSVCEAGVRALAAATPVDTGLTAASWSYEIVSRSGEIEIFWTNSNMSEGASVALLIQLGHGTRNGGYVQGRDYINPALRPIFVEIANNAWKAVTS